MSSTFVASVDVCPRSSAKVGLSSAKASRAISGLAIFFSAFLLFQIQPMIAKMILPWFGGSAVVWTTCTLFFQTVLLLGYAYAHWMSAPTRPGAHWLHIVLLASSLLLVPIIPAAWWKPAGGGEPLPRVFRVVAACRAPPLLCVFLYAPPDSA